MPAHADDQQNRQLCVNASASVSVDMRIEACTALIQSGTLAPQYLSLAYLYRGTFYRHQLDYSRAIADFGEAIRLDPQSTYAYVDRGDLYVGEKDYDQAFADYNEAIRIDPQDGEAYVSRANAYAQQKEYDQAIADDTEAIGIDPAYALAYTNRANAYESEKDYDHAIADYDEAIRLDPANAVAYNGLGRAYYDEKDYDRAIANDDEAIGLDPKNAGYYNDRCWFRAVQGSDLKSALADCDQALALDPKFAAAFDSQGLVHIKLMATKVHFKAVITFGDVSPGAWFEYVAARADYEAAHELDPTAASALYARGLLRKMTAINPADSDADMAAAAAIDPDIASEFHEWMQSVLGQPSKS